jgi:Tol biopolymer transport system component
LYFHYVWSPDGGDWSFWWSGYDLQMLEVKTGKIRRVLPGSGFMSFEISPQGTQIAYTREQDKPSIIYIRDLATGVLRKATVLPALKNYARVGDIHWSPSGQRVAFQTETDDGIVRTIYLNAATMEQSVIKEYQLFTLLFDGWADNGKLQFAEFSADGMRVDKVYRIDVTTSETMLIGTPTVRP